MLTTKVFLPAAHAPTQSRPCNSRGGSCLSAYAFMTGIVHTHSASFRLLNIHSFRHLQGLAPPGSLSWSMEQHVPLWALPGDEVSPSLRAPWQRLLTSALQQERLLSALQCGQELGPKEGAALPYCCTTEAIEYVKLQTKAVTQTISKTLPLFRLVKCI
jgi:hypothetical protein